MTYRVRVLEEAHDDVERRLRYLAKRWGREVAVHWYNDFRECAESLRAFPARFPVAHELQVPGVEARKAVFGQGRNQHILLFSLHDDLVRVLRVVHTSRDFFDRDDDWEGSVD